MLLKRSVLSRTILITLALGSSSLSAQTDNITLPDLGSTSSGVLSAQQEKSLGQAWLRMFRAQAPTENDPLLFDYTKHIVERLAEYSDLKDKQISLVLVDNTSLNAFAVPGNVMGVNVGLYLAAETVDEFASVIAHELGHLSQKHFSRGVQKQQESQIPLMAAMLASLAIAATGNGQAGMAGMMATQAAAQQSALRFSRQNEQEADRIGISTLANAGYDPDGMPLMFEEMNKEMRFWGTHVPEYLLTHPLTEKRVADGWNRARSYPHRQHPDDPYYHTMRVRAEVLSSKNLGSLIELYKEGAAGSNSFPDAARYGLVMVWTRVGQYDKAEQMLKQLIQKDPNNSAYAVAAVELAKELNEFERAEHIVKNALKNNPRSFPLRFALAESYYDSKDFTRAGKILNSLSKQRPDNAQVWYLLAETRGLEGDIVGVHRARAEWFTLNGAFSRAYQQLQYAMKLMKQQKANHIEVARVQQRMRELQRLQTESEML